jgi:hypothetical protein
MSAFMSKQPLLLTIANPCDQSWDEMQPSGMGRNCTHCQKTVIDFTHWSDAALYEFFAKSETRVCGRFLKTQVDRTITIPHQPHSKLYRLTIALGFTLIFAQTPEAIAQNRPPRVQHSKVEHHKTSKRVAPKQEQDQKPYVVKGYKKSLVDLEENRTMITGEVVEREKAGNPDTMRIVPVPPMMGGKKPSSPGDIQLDVDHPTKKVFKRQ